MEQERTETFAFNGTEYHVTPDTKHFLDFCIERTPVMTPIIQRRIHNLIETGGLDESPVAFREYNREKRQQVDSTMTMDTYQQLLSGEMNTNADSIDDMLGTLLLDIADEVIDDADVLTVIKWIANRDKVDKSLAIQAYDMRICKLTFRNPFTKWSIALKIRVYFLLKDWKPFQRFMKLNSN
jgi:hypothetical protein